MNKTVGGHEQLQRLILTNKPAALPKRRAILVLGMHRSGTSAFGGVINALGAAVPKTLMSPNEWNPRGYFESAALFLAHDELLASAGSDWHDWRQINPQWFRSQAAERHRQKIKATLIEEFGDEPLILIKDPRVCRFIPFFLSLLAELEVTPVAILPVRNPLEVAYSLKQRDAIALPKSILLWLRHMLEAEFHSRHLPRCFLSYEGFLSDWRLHADRASEKTGIEWPSYSDRSDVAINEFLTPDLRHQRVSFEELKNRSDVMPLAHEAYDILADIAAGGENQQLLDRLDFVRAKFDDGCQFFAAAVEHEKSAAIKHLRNAATLATTYNRLACEHDALIRARDDLNREYQALASAHDSLHFEHEALASAHNNLVIEHDALASTYNRLNSEHEALASAHNNLITEHDALASTYSRLNTEHEALASAHNNLITEHDALASTYNGLNTEHEALASAHNNLITEHDGLASTYNGLNTEHEALALAHNNLIIEHDALASTYNRVNTEHEALAFAHNPLIIEHEALASTYNRLNTEHEALALAYNNLTTEHDALACAHNNLVTEHGVLASTYNRLNSEHEALACAHYNEVTEHGALASIYRDLASAHDRLNSQRQALNSTYSKLNSEHEAVVSTHNNLMVEQEALKSAHDNLIAAHEKLARDYDRLAAECDALAAARSGLCAARDAMLASHSWRITAPLRYLRMSFGRIIAVLRG
jgi:hypothetical protein